MKSHIGMKSLTKEITQYPKMSQEITNKKKSQLRHETTNERKPERAMRFHQIWNEQLNPE